MVDAARKRRRLGNVIGGPRQERACPKRPKCYTDAPSLEINFPATRQRLQRCRKTHSLGPIDFLLSASSFDAPVRAAGVESSQLPLSYATVQSPKDQGNRDYKVPLYFTQWSAATGFKWGLARQHCHRICIGLPPSQGNSMSFASIGSANSSTDLSRGKH